ncbi:uncharacterized protein LOC142540518 isoform X1 [Primulina tabacum]|uniref:uncharacterized protein LOC142540518 isoform X1 n=1 Tax=Primulina tabacum TaxID=48773 RepID=UPI003F5A2086
METKEKNEKDEAEAVADFVRKEVSDWDDEVKGQARFKALSGQRSVWEPLYFFWRDLIIKVARHLGIFLICPSHVQSLWFHRNGLSPLCLHSVLVEMCQAGVLLPLSSAHPPTVTSHLSHFLRKSINFLVSRPSISNDDSLTLSGDSYILAALLEERALEVIKTLSENHWTISCVITMRKFQDICLGSKEALVILNYLSTHGKAKHLVMNTAERIEGVKVCLTTEGAVANASSMDYSVLHLIWTAEKLEQQLNVIDQRYHKTRNSALAFLKSGNKIVALKYARELKQVSLSREKCTALLERVEKVIQVIADAESSKMVSEALQISSRAIQENQITVEEVELCLQEIDENIHSMKQVDSVLESSPVYTDLVEEDIEDEFKKLQQEISGETTTQFSNKNGDDNNNSVEAPDMSSTTDLLGKALSNLNLKDDTSMGSVAECSKELVSNKSTQKIPVSSVL